VTGWYKRKAQIVILIIAAIVTVSLNADSLQMANALYTNKALRASFVAAASDLSSTTPSGTTDADAQAALDALNEQVPQLPLGWKVEEWDRLTGLDTARSDAEKEEGGTISGWALGRLMVGRWVAKLLGWLATVLAISQGAPFWFDMLNKVINLRSSGTTTPRRPATK
jgi:hypothetical protein